MFSFLRDAMTINVTAALSLKLAEDGGRPVVEREVLKYRRGRGEQPWHFIDFSRGTGEGASHSSNKQHRAVFNELL